MCDFAISRFPCISAASLAFNSMFSCAIRHQWRSSISQDARMSAIEYAVQTMMSLHPHVDEADPALWRPTTIRLWVTPTVCTIPVCRISDCALASSEPSGCMSFVLRTGFTSRLPIMHVAMERANLHHITTQRLYDGLYTCSPLCSYGTTPPTEHDKISTRTIQASLYDQHPGMT